MRNRRSTRLLSGMVLLLFAMSSIFVQPPPAQASYAVNVSSNNAAYGTATNGTTTQGNSILVFGSNAYGQYGNGAAVASSLPIQSPNLSGFTTFASGGTAAYGIDSTGQVWAWGMGTSGQLGNGGTTSSTVPVKVSNMTNITAIAAGSSGMAYALDSTGRVWAWGANANGQLGNGSTTNSSVPVPVGALSSIISIAAGQYSGYALDSTGQVWGWGYDGYGALGNGLTANATTPVKVSNITGVTAIAASDGNGYALDTTGQVWSWGIGTNSQLGNGTTTSSYVPVKVSNITGVTAIAAGGGNGYALDATGQVWAWGMGAYGQLGNGGTVNSSIPVQVSNVSGILSITKLRAGNNACYALDATGQLWDWGYNLSGQLGNGNTTNLIIPTKITLLTGLTDIVGNQAVFAIQPTTTTTVIATPNTGYQFVNWTENGTPVSNKATYTFVQTGNRTLVANFASLGYSVSVSPNNAAYGTSTNGGATQTVSGVWAWGTNTSGQFGNGTTTSSNTPIQDANLSGYSKLAVDQALGAGFGIDSTGQLWAWGANNLGQLGNGTTTNSTVPIKVPNMTNITAVAISGSAIHALDSTGKVWSWGPGTYGQLGNGSSANSTVPVPVGSLTNVVAIAAGEYSGYALDATGQVWAWGEGTYGELGNGTTTGSSIPVKVANLSNITAIASGSRFVLALDMAGSVWGWGDNMYGELGNGTTTTSSAPVKVSNISGIASIAASANNGYALDLTGQVWSWGYATTGGLGNSSSTSSNVPVQVSSASGMSGVTAISGGVTLDGAYAIDSTGQAWAWGANTSGQQGNGTTTNNFTPAKILVPTGITSILGDGTVFAIQSTTTATVVATPNTGYQFVNWTESGTPVSTSATYTFNETGARTLVSNFTPTSFTITAQSGNAAQGSVTGGGTYNSGTQATLVATPNTGYQFVNWTDTNGTAGINGSTATNLTFAVTANDTITANFASATTPSTPVSGITVSPTTMTLLPGGTQQLTPTISPSNATNQNVNYFSTNTSIATVSSTGLVTAVASGAATIIVTTQDGGYTATSAVTVSSTNTAVTGVTLNPATATLAINGTQQLTPAISPTNATNQNVTYSSDNTAIATVSTSGLVTVVAPGTATITVTTQDGGYTATSTITVSTNAVTGVTLSPSASILLPGGTQQLTAATVPTNATNQNVTYSSNNTAVATVSSSGLVTAIAPGTAIIAVTTQDGGYTATSTVTVVSLVTGVSVTPTTITLNPNQTQQLTPTISPTNATNKTVTYSSSNTAVATVLPTGLVTAIAPGTATITVTTQDGSFTATSTVTVNTPVTGVTSTPSTITLDINGTQQLTPTISPSTATNQNVMYSSSNTAVATVSTTGLVRAVAPGTAQIAVTTQDGNKTATTSVTVNYPPATGVTWTETQYGTYQVKWTGGSPSATVTLQNGTGNATVAYTANGIYNSAVFPSTVTPGTYELFIAGTDMRSVTVDAPTTTTTTTTPVAPTNASFTKTQYGTYQVRWTGPATATVTLQNGTGNATIAYSANGRYNSAVFPSTVTPGTYELFIGGTDMQSVTVTAPTTTTNTTTTPVAPTNSIFTKTVYGTYQVMWTGPASVKVTLQNGAGNTTIAYSANGYYNSAVFPSTVIPGVYELFIAGTDMQSVTVDAPTTTTTTTTTPVAPTNASFIKTQYGTYQVRWTGPATATVTLQNGTGNVTIAYTANGTYNSAVFPSNITPGTYELFIAGTDMQSVIVYASNVTWTQTTADTYTVMWIGPATATVTLQNGTGNATIAYTANGTANTAVFTGPNPGTYELFIAGAAIKPVTVAEPPTNATWTKTVYGTYQVKWTGPATATVTLQNGTGNTTVAYTANGTYNSAVFPSSVTPGTYELFIAGTDMQSITVN